MGDMSSKCIALLKVNRSECSTSTRRRWKTLKIRDRIWPIFLLPLSFVFWQQLAQTHKCMDNPRTKKGFFLSPYLQGIPYHTVSFKRYHLLLGWVGLDCPFGWVVRWVGLSWVGLSWVGLSWVGLLVGLGCPLGLVVLEPWIRKNSTFCRYCAVQFSFGAPFSHIIIEAMRQKSRWHFRRSGMNLFLVKGSTMNSP